MTDDGFLRADARLVREVRAGASSARPGTASKPSYWAHGQGVEASHGEAASPKRFFNKANERLYEAYSQLHTMAQEFDKPFDGAGDSRRRSSDGR